MRLFRPGASRRSRWLVLVVTLVVLEISLRGVLGNYASSKLRRTAGCSLEPGASVLYTGWLFRLAPVLESVNEYGFRGAPRAFEKSAGTLRILAIGDSFTFGQGVPDDQTLPAAIEERLAPTGSRGVEVLNFGIEGLNLEEALNQYTSFASRWEHDVVLYLMSPNDLGGPGCIGPGWAHSIFRECYVLRVPMMAFILVTGSMAVALTQLMDINPPTPDTERVRLVTALRRFQTASRQQGARFGVVMLGNPQGEVESWRQQVDFPLVDVSSILDDWSNRIPLEGHLNEAGNGRVADAVAEWLLDSSSWPRLLDR